MQWMVICLHLCVSYNICVRDCKDDVLALRDHDIWRLRYKKTNKYKEGFSY